MVLLPSQIYDKESNSIYDKGKLLGKGGFAKCYEISNDCGAIFACKVIIKSSLKSGNNKEKLSQEILIHKTLNHVNIVQFNHYFHDSSSIYIILEFCPNKTLNELIKRRKFITEPETRYFVIQIASGCVYLHMKKIIHRDLKLANIFLDKDLIIKIGDFGLATQVEFNGQKKKTLCGTPNYVAPEILRKEGHSYEVDVWSIGCIIYTLLIGSPPFETEKLQDTYSRIKKNSFNIPYSINEKARNVITMTLHDDFTKRPTMISLLKMSFFEDYTPNVLPKSVLTTAPRFDNVPCMLFTNITNTCSESNGVNTPTNSDVPSEDRNKYESYQAIVDLKEEIFNLLNVSIKINSDSLSLIYDCEDPTLSPIYWVSRWVDFTGQYGMSYQLIDGSIGVVFNDSTILILTSNNKNIQYIEKCGKERLYIKNQNVNHLEKKLSILNHFHDFMHTNLLSTGEHKQQIEKDALCRLPYVKVWLRNKSGIVFYLSNGTFQMNFIDHVKIILCPLMKAVTYISDKPEFKTFSMAALKQIGITKDLYKRIEYSLKMIQELMMMSSFAVRGAQ